MQAALGAVDLLPGYDQGGNVILTEFSFNGVIRAMEVRWHSIAWGTLGWWIAQYVELDG